MPEGWLWIALGSLATFAATQVWPFLRSMWDMGYKAELEQRKAETAQRRADSNLHEERYLAALEVSAQAQLQQSENGREIAAAIRTIAETRVTDNLVLQRVERELEKALTLLIELATLQGHTPDTRVRPRRTKVVRKESGNA